MRRASNGDVAHLCLILHAHLPFVRHPDIDRSLEEDWLFEAVAESYLPLVKVFRGWERDRVKARVVFGMTPPLVTMLDDPLLRERCARYLRLGIELAEREVGRTAGAPQSSRVARFYLERFRWCQRLYEEELRRDLVGEFLRLREAGIIEIAASAATHAVLPLFSGFPEAIRAQVLVGRDIYRARVGIDPGGFWLPECGYGPGIDGVLGHAGVRWFALEKHGLLCGRPAPIYHIYRPCFTPSGPAAFARDRTAAAEIWNSVKGYPGDARYREFYRDIGHDLPLEDLACWLGQGRIRRFTGLKYHRVTGRGVAEKQWYDRGLALEAVGEHVEHFLNRERLQFAGLAETGQRGWMICLPFDAELFGHWWFEGPEFLDGVVRALVARSGFRLVTPCDYLQEWEIHQIVEPVPSSWGEGGGWGVWMGEHNAWIYPMLFSATAAMIDEARRAAASDPGLERGRVLRQMARELMLAQSSDWPFLMCTQAAREYAQRRVQVHLERFDRLRAMLRYGPGAIDQGLLEACEGVDNIFPALEWRYYI